ncbi:MFS transporter [Nocardia paucivorans]|uniref:MFS transporter n=1 Tax=Nocardia paucivorans TaxID=114259 RepID=UPI00030D3A7A|nr:MFS transporter [Nocardia paucivorans]
MTRTDPPPAETRAGDELAAWLSFTACLISVFMQMIDVTIVNTALPSITSDLQASSAQQLLMVSGYSLAFACALLIAARIGALMGRRTMFLVSVVVFTAASVWCGMSGSATELVIARVAQGMAGAGMAAQTIAIITAGFPKRLHPVVFAIYGATAGFAGMCGPLFAGVLVTADIAGLGWNSIFLMNLPLGTVAFVLAWRYLRSPRSPERPRLDLGGVVLSTVGLFGLLYALAEIHHTGWRPIPCLVIAGAIVVGAVFLWYERYLDRRAAGPLIRPYLFADRGFALGSVLVTCFFGVFTAFVFAISITLQDVLHFSPLRTGLAMTPFALGAGAGALLSPPAVRRWGVRVLAAGLALYGGCVAVGVVYLWITDGEVNLWLVSGPVFSAGFGVGLFGVPLQPLMLSGLNEQQMAEASGVVPTIEQIGNGVGLALLSATFFRAHTLGGSTVMFSAIAVVAVGMAALTLALPDPVTRPDIADATAAAP